MSGLDRQSTNADKELLQLKCDPRAFDDDIRYSVGAI